MAMDFQNGKIQTALNGDRKIAASDTQSRDIWSYDSHTLHMYIYIYII
jgi:hypothetical protein